MKPILFMMICLMTKKKLNQSKFLGKELNIIKLIAVILSFVLNNCKLLNLVLIGCAVLVGIIRVSMFYILSARAAISMHRIMFNKVLKTPMRFFDTNPLGK